MTAEVKVVPLPRLAGAVDGPQRRTDQRQIRGVGRKWLRQFGIDGRRAHPELELRGPGGDGVEIVGRTRLPWDEIEGDLVLRAEDRADLVGLLMFWPALDSVHADRGGCDGAATLPGDDRDCGEGSSFVLQRRVVADRLVGSALPHENRVLGFDRLIRTGQRRDAEELPEDLAAEHPVIFQLLIPALEYVRIAVPRQCRGDVETRPEDRSRDRALAQCKSDSRRREPSSQRSLAANPCEQKSHSSSALMGCATPSSISPLDWAALNMTVCIVIAAIRFGLIPSRS